jgi:hypothetical protein
MNLTDYSPYGYHRVMFATALQIALTNVQLHEEYTP